MELEEMKARWTEMSATIEKQKQITDTLIIKMTQVNYRNRLSKILIPELAGTLVSFAYCIYIIINFHKLNNLIELTEFGDQEVAAKKASLVSYGRAGNATPANQEKEPMSYQHKPYNYYTAVVKQYFPAELSAMKK